VLQEILRPSALKYPLLRWWSLLERRNESRVCRAFFVSYTLVPAQSNHIFYFQSLNVIRESNAISESLVCLVPLVLWLMTSRTFPAGLFVFSPLPDARSAGRYPTIPRPRNLFVIAYSSLYLKCSCSGPGLCRSRFHSYPQKWPPTKSLFLCRPGRYD
jgi:hypothetical protein